MDQLLEKIAETFCDMDFVPPVAGPYFYSRRVRKPNVEDCYVLLLVYVYYVLCCSQNPHMIMDALDFMHYLEDVSVGQPKYLLG